MTSLTAYPPQTISGTITSWLAVDSAWSAPPACSTLVWEGYPPWQVINDPGYGIYVDGAISCLPPAATTWWEQDHTSFRGTTFSLGPIVCPSAYTTALTRVEASSTFVACCPSGYDFVQVEADGVPQQCQSRLTAGQQISLVTYATITSSNVVASAWITSVSTAASGGLITGIQLNGWNFAPTATTHSSIPASTSRPSPTATIAPPAPNNKSRDIGIGVGVSLGVIGVLGICFGLWLIRRRSSKRSRGTFGTQPVAEAHPSNGERFIDRNPVHEIGPSKERTVIELHAPDVPRAELEGGR